MSSTDNGIDTRARTRVMVAAVTGIAAGALMGVYSSYDYLAPLVAWDVAALIFLVWMWLIIWPMDEHKTAKFALAEDPTRATADVALLFVSLASLGAIGLVLAKGGSSGSIDQSLSAIIAIFSIVLSWIVVHTIFTLRYARLYYGHPQGGVDFGEGKLPAYSDFAYLAFTIGMTFQVSDTGFQNHRFRKVALRHSLFSYVFGTLIIATTINLIAGLGN